MKIVKIGSQVLALDQLGLTPGKDVLLTIVGEDGSIIKDTSANDLENLSLDFNSATGKYEVELSIAETTPEQYLRLYFSSEELELDSEFTPQDAKLTVGFTTAKQEIVPVQYFIDYMLSSDCKLDPAYKTAVDGYVKNNREGIRSSLLSAQGKLEKKSKLYFTEREIKEEKKDYYFDRFSLHLWQFMVQNPPINELVSFKIQYANNPVAVIDPKLFVFDRLQGIIEFLPVPGGDSAGLYSLLMSNLSGLALTILTNSNIERIPNMFIVTYKTGLIYNGCDEAEKESIRQTICKRTLRELQPIIDPSVRQGNRTESIDGASSSRSYNNDKIFDRYEKEEEEFINDLRRFYGRNIDMVIV